MSKKIIPILFVLLQLAGCSANKDLPQNTDNSFSSVSNTSEVQQDETLTDEPTSTITDSIVSSTKTEVIAEPTESRETVSSESNQKADTIPTTQASEQMPTQPQTKTAEAEKEPTYTQPVEQPIENATQPTEPEPQISEKTETTEPTEPIESFDIDYWINFARSYAQNKGLCLDSAAVDCWDNPIRAGSHYIYLERDIQSRLNRYANDEDITDVWIWFEPVGNDCYDIYIGYA